MTAETTAETTPQLTPASVIGRASEIDEAFGQRVGFLLEIDRLKTVLRRSRIVDASRYENTAEHSWHLAMLVLALGPHAGADVDQVRALQMLVVHDLVEIDAGDTYVYDEAGHDDKAEREQAAADRIFGLLPDHEGAELRALWDEYEERATPTAAFAYACDRLQPLLLNAASGGQSWAEHGIRRSQVLGLHAPIAETVPTFGRLVEALVDDAVAAGALAEG